METSTGGLQHQNGLVTPASGFEQIFVLIFSTVLRNWALILHLLALPVRGRLQNVVFIWFPICFVWWYKYGNICLSYFTLLVTWTLVI
jgi:hypothetical protein